MVRQRTFLVLCLLSFVLPAAAAPNLFSVSPYVQHPDTNAMSILFFTTDNVKATVKVTPPAADLSVRAEIRDVRDRIVKRTVVPLDATKETVDVAFDPQLLEHSANFLDV